MSRRRASVSLWVSLLLAAVLPGAAGCSVNPATGESSFTGLMSESDEVRIGRESHPQVLAQFGGAYQDPELDRYIDSLGQLLAHASDRPNLQYHFTVLDSPIVNAFATPGGYVYITRGLLALANNEAEVAGVLAHEIGHVAARHAAERQSQAVLASIPGILTGVVTGSGALSEAVNSGAAAHLQSYSRDQEYQADLLGVRYLSRTNYDPLGMASFLGQLEANDRLDAEIMGRPEMADQFSIMSTHPRTADRIQRAIQEAGGTHVSTPLTERDLYLAKVDGLRYGDEPEQGFIRDRQFLHPVLRFAFSVPAGFHMMNSSEAVIAQRADGAALLASSTQKFTSAQMIDYLTAEWAPRLQMTDAETIDVNGRDAATGSGQLELKSGVRDVRLVAIRFDANTIFRFLFLTKPEQTAGLARELQQTTYSFRRLSAAEAARLHPQTIRVVTVRGGDTVAKLAAKMPFPDFREERFRVLNGLGAADRLTPGRRVKLIVE
ncbi:MAG TPA: M48 family metalloprotease [Candidatus Acidoferrum sp.]|nr:M48 family metalloprotease [Candidatus Acidoferrum sp.]